MLTAHTDQSHHAPPRLHGLPMYVPPAQPGNLLILRERPDVVAARIARKSRVRAAVLAVHGTLKREALAAILGHASTRVVQRCLSDSNRDEFSVEHMSKLGVAGCLGDERRAA